MAKCYPCGGLDRRAFLARAAGPPPAGGHTPAPEPKAAPGPAGPGGALGAPGPSPGRVIEVRHPAMIQKGKKDRAAIKAGVDRGMKELTGADDAVSAWRRFFEPG